MATATIPAVRFEHGDLPPFCVMTGLPAAQMYAIRAGRTQLAVPLHGDVVSSLRRVQNLAKFAFILALGVVLVALAMRSTDVGRFALIPLVMGLGFGWAARTRLPRASIQGDDVVLKGVNQGFVDSLTATPGKCAGCDNEGSCSVAEMDACAKDEHDHSHHDHAHA